MDIDRVAQLMTNLRLANECEAAAKMDMDDAEHRVNVYRQKLAAMKDRHAETELATAEVLKELIDLIGVETCAPLMAIITRD